MTNKKYYICEYNYIIVDEWICEFIHVRCIMGQMTLHTKFESLPPNLKKEVNDFVDFLLSKSKPGTKKPAKFGSAKGKIKMSADFDEPLDDFKDYM